MDKWLSHPTSLKVISVIIGILLWAVVHFDTDSPNNVASLLETRDIPVKVTAEGLDGSLHDLRLVDPDNVRLTVRGNRAVLMAASPEDYRVYVDLTDVQDGEHILQLNYDLPGRVQFIELSPSRVTVDLVPMQTTEYEIQIQTTGEPAHDYKVDTPIVKPGNRAFVTLPEDQLDLVGYVGAVINVDGEENTVTEKRVELKVFDTAGEEMEDAVVNPATVEVEVPIVKPYKTLPLQIGQAGSLPDGVSLLSVTPEVDEVTVYGPLAELEQLEYYDDVVINLSGIQQSGTVTVELDPPPGTAGISPQQLDIAVEVAASDTITVPEVPIRMSGLSDGLEARIVTPASQRVDIQVTGAPGVLAQLGAGDIQLIADLNGQVPGTHEIPLEIQLPRFVREASGGSLSVTVEITTAEEVFAPESEEPGDEGTPGSENEEPLPPEEEPITDPEETTPPPEGGTNDNNSEEPANPDEPGAEQGNQTGGGGVRNDGDPPSTGTGTGETSPGGNMNATAPGETGGEGNLVPPDPSPEPGGVAGQNDGVQTPIVFPGAVGTATPPLGSWTAVERPGLGETGWATVEAQERVPLGERQAPAVVRYGMITAGLAVAAAAAAVLWGRAMSSHAQRDPMRRTRGRLISHR
ncbi:CdaR family protein [Paenibacillus daejeonensis]|uniref:CdaR family protein n=1 Tax=Paenibacillus daejeonensis TaxID=135193 RepID=UPI000368C590|nr:CdaR family protein [Paenibacillus daejeonensis]